MSKKIVYTVLSIIFFSFIWQTFAMTSTLEIDREKANVDETLHLQINLDSQWWWNIQIDQIPWIEKFDVIGKSQSSSFSSINWQVSSRLSFDFSIIPKEKWSYEIWPVVIFDGTDTTTTNAVKIEITWEKIFVNRNQSNNIAVLPQTSKSLWQEKTINEEPKSEHSQIFLLLWILSILTLIVYFILKQNKFLETQAKIISNEQKDLPFQKTIIYPEIQDENFAVKVDEIFRQKISQDFCIDTKNKNYSEILEAIWETEKKQNIQECIDLLNQLKYSHFITSNAKILELLKEI